MSDARESNFEQYQRQVQTASGPVGYLDSGGDLPVALFVHGVATGSSCGATRSRCWPISGAASRSICRCTGAPRRRPDQEFTLTRDGRIPDGVLRRARPDRVRSGRQRHRRRDLPGLRGTRGEAAAHVHPHQLRYAGQLPAEGVPADGLAGRAGTARAARPAGAQDSARVRRRHARRARSRTSRAVPQEVTAAWAQPVFATRQTARQFQRWLGEDERSRAGGDRAGAQAPAGADAAGLGHRRSVLQAALGRVVARHDRRRRRDRRDPRRQAVLPRRAGRRNSPPPVRRSGAPTRRCQGGAARRQVRRRSSAKKLFTCSRGRPADRPQPPVTRPRQPVQDTGSFG